ncbi:MAG TPA: hypothetical protein VLL75_14330 [Vicinamibacteria bacterium]|nr:hypothetical protein [Vicinamibacteria bacterium]
MTPRLLRLAPLALAVACGPADPSPSPSPTATDPCATAPSRYGAGIAGSWIPACSLAQDIYNDASKAVGPPDAAGSGPAAFTGFVSLGFGGHVTVDLGGCISDAPGPDIRVYQAVSSEPVSVYVSTLREGPFTLVEALKDCGEPYAGIQRHCDVDLASGGVTRARYVRVEDGELFPCPGGTVSEGADLDAVEALGVSTAGLP